MLTCPKCGNKYRQGDFCINCGTKLKEELKPTKPVKEKTEPPPKRGGIPPFLVGMLVVFVIAGILVFLFVVLPILLGLILQIAPMAIAATKLPTSFCMGLTDPTVRATCLEEAPKTDNDQRMKDYYTHLDAISADTKILLSYSETLKADVDAWNAAKTTDQRMAAYNAYYMHSQLYANQLDATLTAMDRFEKFLTINKAYFDGKGMNVEGTINTFATLKTTMKTGVVSIQTNLSTMSKTLALEQQQQQQLSSLLGTLAQLLIGLGG